VQLTPQQCSGQMQQQPLWQPTSASAHALMRQFLLH